MKFRIFFIHFHLLVYQIVLPNDTRTHKRFPGNRDSLGGCFFSRLPVKISIKNKTYIIYFKKITKMLKLISIEYMLSKCKLWSFDVSVFVYYTVYKQPVNKSARLIITRSRWRLSNLDIVKWLFGHSCSFQCQVVTSVVKTHAIFCLLLLYSVD